MSMTLAPFDKQLVASALDHAPFAALVFLPDDRLTMVWRNNAHAQMTRTPELRIAGHGMFEVFAPNDKDDASAAKSAICAAVARICETRQPEDIGQYRYDLMSTDGQYVEHHWQINMSPVIVDERVVAIMQISRDVTDTVLSARLSLSLSRAAGKTAAVSYFSFDPVSNEFIRGEGVDQMFGFAPGEVGTIAAPFFDRVHADDLQSVYAEVERVFSAPKGDTASFDYRILLPNGDERFIRIRAEVATDPKDRRDKLVGSFIDLTDVENTRRALVKAVEAREALVDEANHRVKNSLQIAIAMLRIETRALANSEAPSVQDAMERLHAVRSRIGAVADVHGLMQIGKDTTLVSVPALLEKLVDFTRRSSDLSRGTLTCRLNAIELSVDSGVAISLGLILNELLTNALKYGVSPDGEATIHVELAQRENGFSISVENGLHVASRFGDIASTHVGWRLVEQLAEQIGVRVQRQSTDQVYKVELELDHAV